MPFKAYTPFELGELAFHQGHPMSTNPFTIGTWENHEWRAGYLVAKATAVA